VTEGPSNAVKAGRKVRALPDRPCLAYTLKFPGIDSGRRMWETLSMCLCLSSEPGSVTYVQNTLRIINRPEQVRVVAQSASPRRRCDQTCQQVGAPRFMLNNLICRKRNGLITSAQAASQALEDIKSTKRFKTCSSQRPAVLSPFWDPQQ
jgi:hypothetical protein